MKCLRRTLLNTLTILSLLLCLTALVFWFRSYNTADEIRIAKENFSHWLELTSRVGRLAIDINSTKLSYRTSSRWKTVAVTDRYIQNVRFLRSGEKSFLGFTFERNSWGSNYYIDRQTSIEIPYYALTVLCAIFPVVIAIRRLRKVLARRNPKTAPLCPTCNYDLRATPNRCPECGTIPKMA